MLFPLCLYCNSSSMLVTVYLVCTHVTNAPCPILCVVIISVSLSHFVFPICNPHHPLWQPKHPCFVLLLVNVHCLFNFVCVNMCSLNISQFVQFKYLVIMVTHPTSLLCFLSQGDCLTHTFFI